MSKAPRLPARVFGVAALVLSGWLPASPLLAAPAVQVGFSPEGTAQQLVLSVIGEAQRDIRLMGYAFTSPEVTRALIAAHRRGVTVRVVVDAKANQNGAGRAALNLLANGTAHPGDAAAGDGVQSTAPVAAGFFPADLRGAPSGAGLAGVFLH
ncbi:TPA: phospholipase D-like domain-containing protein [Serratia marcescens]